ncbi:hypothetical protein E2C01_072080 [Portunus trituberculatus]|uniref:Uncharacterized protein n=1 Tax=Portunus trituberculatus TaxID=210409 RepID=A0A5B7I1Q0_PORTR|nr:hypothetical protein [Portunus trituberculatus]
MEVRILKELPQGDGFYDHNQSPIQDATGCESLKTNDDTKEVTLATWGENCDRLPLLRACGWAVGRWWALCSSMPPRLHAPASFTPDEFPV